MAHALVESAKFRSSMITVNPVKKPQKNCQVIQRIYTRAHPSRTKDWICFTTNYNNLHYLASFQCADGPQGINEPDRWQSNKILSVSSSTSCKPVFHSWQRPGFCQTELKDVWIDSSPWDKLPRPQSQSATNMDGYINSCAAVTAGQRAQTGITPKRGGSTEGIQTTDGISLQKCWRATCTQAPALFAYCSAFFFVKLVFKFCLLIRLVW